MARKAPSRESVKKWAADRGFGYRKALEYQKVIRELRAARYEFVKKYGFDPIRERKFTDIREHRSKKVDLDFIQKKINEARNRIENISAWGTYNVKKYANEAITRASKDGQISLSEAAAYRKRLRKMTQNEEGLLSAFGAAGFIQGSYNQDDGQYSEQISPWLYDFMGF